MCCSSAEHQIQAGCNLLSLLHRRNAGIQHPSSMQLERAAGDMPPCDIITSVGASVVSGCRQTDMWCSGTTPGDAIRGACPRSAALPVLLHRGTALTVSRGGYIIDKAYSSCNAISALVCTDQGVCMWRSGMQIRWHASHQVEELRCDSTLDICKANIFQPCCKPYLLIACCQAPSKASFAGQPLLTSKDCVRRASRLHSLRLVWSPSVRQIHSLSTKHHVGRFAVLVLALSADVMRASGGLLRLLPLAGSTISRTAPCSSQHILATCLAAGAPHSLEQSPACVHTALHPHAQPALAVSLQCFSPGGSSSASQAPAPTCRSTIRSDD